MRLNRLIFAYSVILASFAIIMMLDARRRDKARMKALMDWMSKQEGAYSEAPPESGDWQLYVVYSTAADYAQALEIAEAAKEYTRKEAQIKVVPVERLLSYKDCRVEDIDQCFPGLRNAPEYPVTYLTIKGDDGSTYTVAEFVGRFEDEDFIQLFENIDELVAEGF